MKHETFNQTSRTTTFTLLRVGVGLIFVAHGWVKLSDTAAAAEGFASAGVPWPEVMIYLAIAGEFFGGLGLLIGLLTKVAALGPLFTMVGAILFVHLGHGLFAQDGGWEYPLTLLLVSLLYVVHGAGPVSVDALLASRRERRHTSKSLGHRPPEGTPRQHPA